jgi:hypothetical protein
MSYFVVTLYKTDSTEEKITVEYTWDVKALFTRFLGDESIRSMAIHKREG